MPSRFCFIYPWATLGGVERVLLNRLIAFNEARLSIDVDIMFLHDSGGAQPFRDVLRKLGIDARVIVATDFPPDVFYDMVFCIDCPQAFSLCERRGFRFLAECHTSYLDNRKYLQNLPDSCELIVTPSALFGDRVRHEVGVSSPLEIFELRNFVPWDVSHSLDALEQPGWKKKPIFFFGRMDAHKDPIAMLDAFCIIEKMRPGKFFCILCGPESEEVDIFKEIRVRNIFSNVFILPPLSFNSTGVLLDLIKNKGGVFVSPSKGESFGLSAAEAICAGIPVILSDIDEHCALVQGYADKFTYRLGDKKSLGAKILEVFDSYESASAVMLEVREIFSSVVFLKHWNVLLGKLNIQ